MISYSFNFKLFFFLICWLVFFTIPNWIQNLSDSDSTAPKAQQEPQCPYNHKMLLITVLRTLQEPWKTEAFTWSVKRRVNKKAHTQTKSIVSNQNEESETQTVEKEI